MEQGLSDATGEERVFLVFRIASTWLAAEPRHVQELAEPGATTPVPRAPAYVAGLMPLRGRAVPLLDVREFLGLDPAESRLPDQDLSRRIVVVSCAGMTVGLLADRVRSLIRVPRAALLPPESLPPGRVREFAEGHTADATGAVVDPGEVIVVLKLEALLQAARVRLESAIA